MRLYDNPVVWRESNDTWDERKIQWKIIGNHNEEEIKNRYFISEKLRNILLSFISDNFFIPKVTYHIIEYKSGRLDIGYDFTSYIKDSYVILEADRGEDCGKILGIASDCKLNKIFENFKDISNEIESKRILRYATDLDIEELIKREADEIDSLEKCKELVIASNITMDILSCEYQWDKKKITFYFKSTKRIDFRDLLKDLFKLFKIRIWLCAEKKSFNVLLRSLLDK